MKRKLIASTLVAALALTSLGSAPAYAGQKGERTAKIIAGAAALYIIGKAIEDSHKRTSKPKTVHQPYHGHGGKVYRHHGHSHHHYNGHRHYVHKPKPKAKTYSKYLPLSCKARRYTDAGYRELFSRWCLSKKYNGVKALPQTCTRSYYYKGKVLVGYGPKCLRNKGYRYANR